MRIIIKKVREEDDADKWLRDHDPYYSEKSRNKRAKSSHPYETPKQEKRRCEMEIPFSSLSLNQRKEVDSAGGDVKTSFL